LPTLNLIFKTYSRPEQRIEIQVSPQKLFRDLLRENIRPAIGKGETEVFFVHLGKPINILNRIEEELVEDGSEILIVDFKRREEPKGKGN
jgi:hypothetical protein